ncbi:MAG: BolA family transcriptional regulator [Polyangiaceae bacterium]|nr:BolA family transcriptional regulator [Polyangiaceae bacterium]
MTRAERIRTALETSLHPTHLEVLDESSMHSVPKGAESHFKLIVVSDAFGGKSRIDRHRVVNGLLKDEMSRGLHALTVTAFTPEEWNRSPEVQASPACLGGSKGDATKTPGSGH